MLDSQKEVSPEELINDAFKSNLTVLTSIDGRKILPPTSNFGQKSVTSTISPLYIACYTVNKVLLARVQLCLKYQGIIALKLLGRFLIVLKINFEKPLKHLVG